MNIGFYLTHNTMENSKFEPILEDEETFSHKVVPKLRSRFPKMQAIK